MIDWTKPLETIPNKLNLNPIPCFARGSNRVFINGPYIDGDKEDVGNDDWSCNEKGEFRAISGAIRNVIETSSDWAYKEAISRCGHDIGLIPNTAIIELARMIEKHEQPPIDPDEQLAQDTALRHGFPPNGDCFVAILDAVKQVRANAL